MFPARRRIRRHYCVTSAAAWSVALREIVNCVELRNVAACPPVVSHCRAREEVRPCQGERLRPSARNREAGDRLLSVGAGLLTAKFSGLDAPRPALDSSPLRVTSAAAWSVALREIVNCVELRNVAACPTRCKSLSSSRGSSSLSG